VPTLDNLRKTAKRWLASLRAGDPDARARFTRAYPNGPAQPTLRDVQHALARERGHDSWIALKRAVVDDGGADGPLTALLTAAGRGNAETVAAILDEHPGIINTRGVLPEHTGLRTALHFGSGHPAVVGTLLDRGADPNIRDEGDNAYPLHFAAERGDLAVVTMLVEHGADPIGAGTTHDLDVLGWAVCFDYAYHEEVARYLLAHGARHTLLSAVAMGDTHAIRELAAAGADLNQRMDRTNHRRTPLHLAVVKKQVDSLAALIEAGAAPDLEDAAGLTPLDQAALDGEASMTRLLIDAGATLTLPAAIALERADVIEQLVLERPELLAMTTRNRWGQLLVRASERAPGRVVDALIRTVMRYRAGLSVVNVADDEQTAIDGASGYTPLHAAAFRGNDEAVDVLLKHGADPRARDAKYCGTPAGWAAFAGHMTTANRILEANIDIFDAINFDRADRIGAILDRDAAAIDRPFKAYASCPSKEGQWWPTPECTPLEWASSQGKTNAIRSLSERHANASPADRTAHAERVATFLRAACWDEHVHGKRDHRRSDRTAQRLLSHDPTIARDSIHTAVVCGDIEEVRRILAAQPEAARAPGGARGWTPILYLAYTRFSHASTLEHAVTIADVLLDHGADPNDFYMAGDARYDVLSGVAGEGEQDSPRQPYAAAMFERLLERGAEPFDVQVLYNTHFSGDMLWWLELVHKHTIDTTRGDAWRDPEWHMFDMGAYGSGARFVLETAVNTRNLTLAEWALAHGANPDSPPARDTRFPRYTVYEWALLNDTSEIAELLARHGASRSTPRMDDEEQFVRACMRLDRDEAQRLLRAHPDYLHSPTAMFHAAKRNRPDVLALLVDLGVSVDVQDRSHRRPLHEAAANNAMAAARFLLERGADVDARESTYNAPPIGWAAHGDRTEMVRLLSGHSRAIWILCANGYVDRVREILTEDPTRAAESSEEGYTPRWWLPDDEAAAIELVEMLVAAGANPAATNKDGQTAADAARRRGMFEVAQRLEQRSIEAGRGTAR
jgi:ankyrin repeat protein